MHSIQPGPREFITLIGSGAAAWPIAARAQRPARLPLIGFLSAGAPSDTTQWLAAFVSRLHELGSMEGLVVGHGKGRNFPPCHIR